MEFTTTAGAFHDALATARHATPSGNASMVAYTGVQLAVAAPRGGVATGVLSATGSDGDTTITATLGVEVLATGAALLPPKPILAYLATLPPEAGLRVLGRETEIEVTATDSQPYRFRTLATTFPVAVASRAEPVEVDLSRLASALDAVGYSVPKDNPGVQLISNASGLTIHSTDNFRLTRAHLPEAGFGEFTGLLPLPVLERIARANPTGVVLDPKGRTVRAVGPDVQITTKLLSTPFPQVDALLSNTPPNSVLLPVAPARAALKRLESVAEAAPLKVSVADDTIVFSVANADLGSGVERVALPEGSSASVEFAVKLSYLAEAFASHSAKEVSLMWTNAAQAVFVRSTEPLAVTSLVMPIRL